MRAGLRCLLGIALAACASQPKQRIPVGLLIDGDRAGVGAIPAQAVPGLELRPLELPPPSAPVIDDSASIVGRARGAYVHGDFTKCRNELATVDVARLLELGERTVAARALAFDAACAFGAQSVAEAHSVAQRLASLGLDLPDAPLATDVEAMISATLAELGQQPRHALSVTGEVGARLSIDGRSAGCSLPCALDLPPGDHLLVVDADGFEPATRWARIPEEKQIAIAQRVASPQLAARQWRARVARGLPPTDAIGASLIQRLSGQPHVVYLDGGKRVTGTFVFDGVARARAERDRGEMPALIRELAYGARVLDRPRPWQRPWFWIGVSAVALAAAGTIVFITYEPDIMTKVTL